MDDYLMIMYHDIAEAGYFKFIFMSIRLATTIYRFFTSQPHLYLTMPRTMRAIAPLLREE